MHQQSVTFPTGSAPVHAGLLAELIDAARRSLDRDAPLTRTYLDRMYALVGSARDALPLMASMPTNLAAVSKGGLTPWQLSHVRTHIDENLDGTIHVNRLAEVAGLSPGHFCRAFKVTVGEPPHAYLVRQRVRRAQRLMLETGETLSQIACACGLTDQAHLTRLFRRMVGETPMAWRRTWRRLT